MRENTLPERQCLMNSPAYMLMNPRVGFTMWPEYDPSAGKAIKASQPCMPLAPIAP